MNTKRLTQSIPPTLRSSHGNAQRLAVIRDVFRNLQLKKAGGQSPVPRTTPVNDSKRNIDANRIRSWANRIAQFMLHSDNPEHRSPIATSKNPEERILGLKLSALGRSNIFRHLDQTLTSIPKVRLDFHPKAFLQELWDKPARTCEEQEWMERCMVSIDPRAFYFYWLDTRNGVTPKRSRKLSRESAEFRVANWVSARSSETSSDLFRIWQSFPADRTKPYRSNHWGIPGDQSII